jgi:general stress protein YciG
MTIEPLEKPFRLSRKGRGRGFASMSPELRREIASLGGKAAWASGRANRWTPETARIAGRKGGLISRRRARQPQGGN